RSAVSSALARPLTIAIVSPALTVEPSGRSTEKRTSGSSRRKAIAATPSPATTPALRALSTPLARASAGTMISVVRSPARPKSSASAARTKGSTSRADGSAIGMIRLRSAAFDREHALDRRPRADGDLGIDRDLVGHGLERAANLGERDPFHVRAEIA